MIEDIKSEIGEGPPAPAEVRRALASMLYHVDHGGSEPEDFHEASKIMRSFLTNPKEDAEYSRLWSSFYDAQRTP